MFLLFDLTLSFAQNALLEIHTDIYKRNAIKASTFSGGAFKLTNESTGGQKITSFTIDLSTCMMFGMVFDPTGQAGDSDAKSFENDDPNNLAGQTSFSFSKGSAANGYYQLKVNFNDFAPGEVFPFSVDVDPKSIKGAKPPGPNDTGSVSGSEMIGATLTIQYSDGSSQTSILFGKQFRSEAWAQFKPGNNTNAKISVAGVSQKGFVNTLNPTLNFSGKANTNYQIVVMEGGQYNTSTNSLSFEPFECNTYVKVEMINAKTNGVGQGSHTININPTDPATDGYYFLIAAEKDGNNRPIKASNWMIIKYQAGSSKTYYQDADKDGFGNPNKSTIASSPPTGYILDNTDCNDANKDINPNATEIADGIDNNCDGQIDEGIADDDGDGILNPVDNCPTVANPDQKIPTWYADSDGDGFGNPNQSQQACTKPNGYVSNNTDCNDNNKNINPNAPEAADGIDNNCNGQIDEGIADDDGDGILNPVDNCPTVANPDQKIPTWYADSDGDGFGNPNQSQQACTKPNGYVSNNTDCNDNNKNINPNAPEAADGIDNNCNGQIDEGIADDDGDGILNPVDNCPTVPNPDQKIPTWYADADGDGFGNPNQSQQACTKPNGYVSNNTDCNDNNKNINPNAPEAADGIDNNCNGQIDEGIADDDGDGILNPVDNCPTVPNPDQKIPTWYADSDGDGFGNPNQSQQACTKPNGYVADNTDCDDANKDINPNATEIADGIDNNCNGQIDEGIADDDGDGILNPVDNCPTVPNPDQKIPTWYADSDGDGFGNPNQSQQACTKPNGYVNNNTDCNDNNKNINPNAPEIADGIDNNCNGQIDEGIADDDGDGILNPVDNCPTVANPDQKIPTWYADTDGDGFGNPNQSQQACTKPNGYVADNTDCDDANKDINPNAPEIADGIDNNCNGQIDEGIADDDGDGILNPVDNCPTVANPDQKIPTWYADSDGDGFGNPNQSQQACTKPNGYVNNNTDCNDNNKNINPNAPEIADGIDNNCNGQIDEGIADDDGDGILNPNDNCPTVPNPDQKIPTWYADNDGDGFGNPNQSQQACKKPNGYVADNTDCDDANKDINPNAPEIADGMDNNCNGQIDEGIADDDGDGILNPVDNCPTVANPDQKIPSWYADSDGDGFGNPNQSQQACTKPNGYVADNTDCDDANKDINPNATEIADGMDNNCNGQIDEGIADDDGDGILNPIDNCPTVPNPDQKIPTWYADSDGDGFGNPNQSQQACKKPNGYVADNTDCDDANKDINPNAPEIADGMDNNCNGLIDEDSQSTQPKWLSTELLDLRSGNVISRLKKLDTLNRADIEHLALKINTQNADSLLLSINEKQHYFSSQELILFKDIFSDLLPDYTLEIAPFSRKNEIMTLGEPKSHQINFTEETNVPDVPFSHHCQQQIWELEILRSGDLFIYEISGHKITQTSVMEGDRLDLRGLERKVLIIQWQNNGEQFRQVINKL
ncbi:putative metal-binding motif-containing protein [Persicobacter diffluens]|uniref:putative metal-binding motif-containing protein n=1 Tax=Persicobacter diffluens TaxID=981 RepID=UPI0030C6A172